MTTAITATTLGLTEAEAQDLARRGKANTPVSGSTRTTLTILRTTVFSFYNNTLFVIGIALLVLGRYNDALTSVGLGVINAVLAAFQELRAKRQLDRLQLLAREPVTVVRDGADREVMPADVVEGDVLRVRSGGQIVVDGPVVAIVGGTGRLEVDESLLTGESDAVVKSEGDTLLSGSFCTAGECLQRAGAVGADSFAGRLTLAARRDTSGLTPLQWRIELVVRLVIALVVLMSGAIPAQALLEGSTVLRFVQTSAVLSGLVPYGARGKTLLTGVIDRLRSGLPAGLEELATLGRTLHRRRDDVLAYFDHRASNGPTEAINGRLEALRRNALGFRNLINYRIRSLLHCGALAL